jgi:hypothetical protein
MKNKSNINEFEINIDDKMLRNPQITKKLGDLQRSNPNIQFKYGKTSSGDSSIADLFEYDAVIEPKDQATIKYLSNVKDQNTGEISKPFTIDGKNYQMVRGLTPEKNVVMAVYCLDDVDDNGENIIHPMDYFEENIVKPVMEREKSEKQPVEEYDYAAAEREYHDKEDLMDYLNLRDLEGYKHFFVNIHTGEVVAMFKNYREMMRSGIKLGPEEDYMGVKQLKSFRAGEYFKEGFEKANKFEVDENINVDKLKGDVKILIDKMTNMFGKYFSKLDTPVEQAVFLAKIGQLINVPIEKLPQIISSYKDLAKDDPSQAPLTGDSAKQTTESRVITKKELLESFSNRKVIKKIKVKDIK